MWVGQSISLIASGPGLSLFVILGLILGMMASSHAWELPIIQQHSCALLSTGTGPDCRSKMVMTQAEWSGDAQLLWVQCVIW